MPPADAPLESILFHADQIAARVRELAEMITEDVRRDELGELAVVVVADGAIVFAADLIRAIPAPLRLHTVKMNSYGARLTSSGEVRLIGPAPEVRGRDVLIVEDILDTGLTLGTLRTLLVDAGATSVRTAVLLDKPSGRRRPYSAEYVGFTCPDAFVVGYGLDFDGLYRNLPHIGELRRDLR